MYLVKHEETFLHTERTLKMWFSFLIMRGRRDLGTEKFLIEAFGGLSAIVQFLLFQEVRVQSSEITWILTAERKFKLTF